MKIQKKNLALTAALILPLALAGLFGLLKGNRALMDGWVFGWMAPMEQLWGRIWSLFPFSVMEILILLFLGGNLLWLVRAGVLLVRRRSLGDLMRRLLALGAVWLWLWAGLCWLWNAAYYASSFTQRSGLEVRPYSVEELAAVTEHFALQAARLAPQVRRDEELHFAENLPRCFAQNSEVYQELTREFPCLSMEPVSAKPMYLFSRLQSILGFTGMYFPFTGEANVNIDAPACLVPATIAHEMAHQRMVASELEANFVGIAACASCEDPVFQYSGYLMGLIQLCNALYSAAPDRWYAIAEEFFTPELAADWRDNNEYWAALSSPVEDAAGEVYDSFLKSNDQQLGIRSYGACVDLLVARFSGEPAS